MTTENSDRSGNKVDGNLTSLLLTPTARVKDNSKKVNASIKYATFAGFLTIQPFQISFGIRTYDK